MYNHVFYSDVLSVHMHNRETLHQKNPGGIWSYQDWVLQYFYIVRRCINIKGEGKSCAKYFLQNTLYKPSK